VSHDLGDHLRAEIALLPNDPGAIAKNCRGLFQDREPLEKTFVPGTVNVTANEPSEVSMSQSVREARCGRYERRRRALALLDHLGQQTRSINGSSTKALRCEAWPSAR
jgi:hypothetical protein